MAGTQWGVLRSRMNEEIEQTPPKLLVVFPCLNEEKHLEATVRRFTESLKGLPARFVIVDGGSADQTPCIAQRLVSENPHISFTFNPKKFQSAAVNLAVEKFGSEAEFLIRIDIHGSYPNDFCQKLLNEAQNRGADSVVVPMKTQGAGLFQRAAAAAQNSRLGNGGSSHRKGGEGGRWVDHGHHSLMRIDAFRAVGGYDDTFSHNEDAELDARLVKAGKKIWLTGETEMTYFPRATPFALFRQYFKYGQGRARNIVKNHLRPKLRQLMPLIVAPALLLLVLAPLHWIFAVPAFSWALGCLGYGIALGLISQRDVALLIGPAAVIMHLGWSLGFWSFLIKR